MMDLNRFAEESENECPQCGSHVNVTATARDTEPPQMQFGRCQKGHLLERPLGLEASWALRPDQEPPS